MRTIAQAWHWILQTLFKPQAKTIRHRVRRFRPFAEQLETRNVPAVFTVNTLSDLPDPTPNDGILDDVDPITPGNQYSLRGAIQTASAQIRMETFQFQICQKGFS